ncbi:hypothetical protein K438DRAFT_364375 [Mycena galopus ATCC 62051]|nr:hypothetical protein K438DRAFT_364375 [Mycena galopus ATCC 62051]
MHVTIADLPTPRRITSVDLVDADCDLPSSPQTRHSAADSPTPGRMPSVDVVDADDDLPPLPTAGRIPSVDLAYPVLLNHTSTPAFEPSPVAPITSPDYQPAIFTPDCELISRCTSPDAEPALSMDESVAQPEEDITRSSSPVELEHAAGDADPETIPQVAGKSSSNDVNPHREALRQRLRSFAELAGPDWDENVCDPNASDKAFDERIPALNISVRNAGVSRLGKANTRKSSFRAVLDVAVSIGRSFPRPDVPLVALIRGSASIFRSRGAPSYTLPQDLST